MEKYGIVFLPTKEWLVWYDYNKDRDILFSSNFDEVEEALGDFLFADGGYDGDVS